MRAAHALTVLFWLQALLMTIGLMQRVRLWRAGKPAAASWLNIAAAPKRYFVDLHRVVARDSEIATAHIAAAGGAVLVLLLIAANYGLALYSLAFDRALVIAAAIMLFGAWLMWRRRRRPPSRLSRGPWMRLPLMLAAVASGTILLALTAHAATIMASLIATLALALICIGCGEALLGVGAGGPMKHALTGFLHLAFHPRPERFRGSGATALRPIDLQRAPFGAGKPSDFDWNRLLSFDACVECGKCEAACPAFAAGQPLNPKKLIQDLVVGFTGGSDARYAGQATPGLPVGNHSGAPERAILPGLIDERTLWSCTTCRACVEECPMLIEHVDAIVDLRRHRTLMLGELPEPAAACLEQLRTTETQGGYPLAARYDWATDLGLRTLHPGEATEYLLICGEGAYEPRYQKTLRALVGLLNAARVDFAILGALERDCGDTARRLGDEAGFSELAKRNIATLARFNFKHILTADPHALHCLRNEYPALGGHYNVVHHSELLDRLLNAGRLATSPRPATARITYHDPCYLGRYNGEYDAPRRLLQSLGIVVEEMSRSRRTSRCCGGGGGAPLSDIPGARRIPDMRVDDARSIGAEVIAVACPGCASMLQGVVAPRPEIVDIAELVAERLSSP